MTEPAPAAAVAPRAVADLSASTLQLLDARVTVRTDDPDVVVALRTLYAATVTEGEGDRELWFVRGDVEGRAGRIVTVDGSVVVRTPAPGVAFTNLVFELNQLAITATAGVRLHAGAVTIGGGAVVVAGAMGAGKSTLTAGLVQGGAHYLTDEVAAFASGSRQVRPYAKPVSLHRPPPPLRDLWAPDRAVAMLVGATGLVPPHAVGAVAPTPAPLRAVVLPRYVAGAPTTVTRLDAATALTEVAAHTFRLDRAGTLTALADLLADVPVWSLTSGDLGAACRAVHDALEVVGV
jgi:hypothetical protein